MVAEILTAKISETRVFPGVAVGSSVLAALLWWVWSAPFQAGLAAAFGAVFALATAVDAVIDRLPLTKGVAFRNGGQCVHCGYDMRATPNRCPECGMSRRAAAAKLSRILKNVRRVGWAVLIVTVSGAIAIATMQLLRHP